MNLVAKIWGRTTHRCNSLMSKNFWPHTVMYLFLFSQCKSNPTAVIFIHCFRICAVKALDHND